MAAQLSMKAVLPMAKNFATAPCRSSKTGPRNTQLMKDDQPGAVTQVEKGIPHYWPIVRGIQLVVFLTKGQQCGAFVMQLLLI